MNLPSMKRADICTRMLVMSAVRDEIRLLDADSDSKVYDIMELEKLLYSDFNVKYYLGVDLGLKAMLENLNGNYEEGERILRSTISLARANKDNMVIMDALTVNAIMLRKKSLIKSYSMNYEAYTLAKQTNSRYTIVRALTGLILTATEQNDALSYLAELEEYSKQINSSTLDEKIEKIRAELTMQ